MNIQIDNTPPEPPAFDWKTAKYPILGIHPREGTVVLFTHWEIGTQITGNDKRGAGYHFSSWAVENFIPFQGKITLSNT